MTRVLYCQLDIFFWETVSLFVSFFNFKEIKTKSIFLFKHFAFFVVVLFSVSFVAFCCCFLFIFPVFTIH